jgi:hypothetical protein
MPGKITLYLWKQKILQQQLPRPVESKTYLHKGTGPMTQDQD